MVIPKWLKAYILEEQLLEIEQAVRNAEKRTSAELIPVIIHRASTVGHVPYALLLTLLLLWLVAAPLLAPLWPLLAEPFAWILAFVLAFLLTRLLAPRHWVQRLLTPKQDQVLQVRSRAELEFFESDIKKTANSTGILIFISLMEHQVVVLADRAISQKHAPETWSEVVSSIVQGIKSKDLAEGLSRGIELCGKILEKDLPIQPGDKNELPNHLIIKDA